MTVAVAYQASSDSRDQALAEAAREARMRGTDLAVISVTENVDLDVRDAYQHGLNREVEAALGDTEVGWKLQLEAVHGDDVAGTVLAAAEQVGAELLIIGARRRSPVGKFLLGSVTQTLILDAPIPVLVVKAPVGRP